jgi:uncharacterized membrane protein
MPWWLGARVRVLLVVLGLLVVLDLGRSVYARLGYARIRIKLNIDSFRKCNGFAWLAQTLSQ